MLTSLFGEGMNRISEPGDSELSGTPGGNGLEVFIRFLVVVIQFNHISVLRNFNMIHMEHIVLEKYSSR